MTSYASNEFQSTMPSRRQYLAIAFALLSAGVSVSAQQPSTPAPSQAGVPAVESKSTIDTALKPIGDEQAIRSLDNCVVTGTLKQGKATGTFTWKSAAQESWAESDVDSVHTVATSNHGRPMRLANDRAAELSKSTVANSIPLYSVGMSLLRSRDDAGVAITISSSTTTGAAEIHITQAKPGSSLIANRGAANTAEKFRGQEIEPASETWTFDPQTGLPASHVLKPGTYRGRPLAWTAEYKFSDYNATSGVNVPHHIDRYLNDQLIHSYDIQSFQCGVALSTHDFELSGGAK